MSVKIVQVRELQFMAVRPRHGRIFAQHREPSPPCYYARARQRQSTIKDVPSLSAPFDLRAASVRILGLGTSRVILHQLRSILWEARTHSSPPDFAKGGRQRLRKSLRLLLVGALINAISVVHLVGQLSKAFLLYRVSSLSTH